MRHRQGGARLFHSSRFCSRFAVAHHRRRVRALPCRRPPRTGRRLLPLCRPDRSPGMALPRVGHGCLLRGPCHYLPSKHPVDLPTAPGGTKRARIWVVCSYWSGRPAAYCVRSVCAHRPARTRLPSLQDRVCSNGFSVQLRLQEVFSFSRAGCWRHLTIESQSANPDSYPDRCFPAWRGFGSASCT